MEMLDYAEGNLRGVGKTGKKYLAAFVSDFDREFLDLVQSRGYQHEPDGDRPMCKFAIPDPVPAIPLPDGFRLQSLRDENDLPKLQRVLWRGFNHPGEPPAEDLHEQAMMQDTPNYNHSLKIVAVAPGGAFASFCGMWFQPDHRYAYVEPVATDPDYRRMGLGKAAVLEGIRRCGALGAKVAYVGNMLPIYESIGFRTVYVSQCWVKRWEE